MITIHQTIPEFPTFSDLLHYDPDTSVFFDIETTGFSPASSIVFLIGVIYKADHNWQFSQFLAETPQEEKDLIETFLTLTSAYKTFIHFNGSTFDLPYLSQKVEQYKLANTLTSLHSIDLYQKFRPLKKLFSLEHLNQISLERFLKWEREDRLTGRHMISLFQKYTRSKNSDLKELLLLHNHDDLIGMTKLLKLCTYSALTELATDPVLQTNTENVRQIQIAFSLNTAIPCPLSCLIDHTWQLEIQDTSGILAFPVTHGELLYFFPDYKNYYYLPIEDQAIHKSVGTYVDKAHRQQAKAQNCYVRKTGNFLPQPEPFFEPVFRVSYEDPAYYFEYTDAFLNNPEVQLHYIQLILSRLTR